MIATGGSLGGLVPSSSTPWDDGGSGRCATVVIAERRCGPAEPDSETSAPCSAGTLSEEHSSLRGSQLAMYGQEQACVACRIPRQIIQDAKMFRSTVLRRRRRMPCGPGPEQRPTATSAASPRIRTALARVTMCAEAARPLTREVLFARTSSKVGAMTDRRMDSTLLWLLLHGFVRVIVQGDQPLRYKQRRRAWTSLLATQGAFSRAPGSDDQSDG
jgi:hypothetical protein